MLTKPQSKLLLSLINAYADAVSNCDWQANVGSQESAEKAVLQMNESKVRMLEFIDGLTIGELK